MPNTGPKSIQFRGKTEPVLETFRVRGRTYFALERISRRGAYRVFDRHAGPHGDYRVLYKFSRSKVTQQAVEVFRRIGGPNCNRNFPGIVDFARQRDDLFVVVAWVAGTNLHDYLASIRSEYTPRPTASEVVRLVRGLMHGVAHYHRKTNIIHGDISPANIVLTAGTTQLVLVDFGSAWPIERTASKIKGDGVTLPYAAPERMTCHAAEDFRSDAFSLSVVAYELLTLAIPYGGLGGRAGAPNMATKTAKSYRKPSELISAHRLPRQTVRLLDNCLAKGLQLHPDARFETTQEWLGAWDELHSSMKKGARLNRIESLFVGGVEAICRLFSLNSPK